MRTRTHTRLRFVWRLQTILRACTRAFARARSSFVRMLSNADAAVFLTQAL